MVTFFFFTSHWTAFPVVKQVLLDKTQFFAWAKIETCYMRKPFAFKHLPTEKRVLNYNLTVHFN